MPTRRLSCLPLPSCLKSNATDTLAFETDFVSRPGLEQKLDVRLKTLEAAATGINQALYHQCCRAIHETDLPE